METSGFRKILEDWRYAFGWIAVAVIVVAILFSIFLVASTKSALNDGEDWSRTISVMGTGEVVVVPDVAMFDFTVNESAESVAIAQKNATEKINKALDYLKEQGIEEKDLKTLSYNIYPKYEWIQPLCMPTFCPPGRQDLVGYEVSQTTSVKVRDTAKAGELLSGIGSQGITNVGGLSFTTDEPDSAQNEARKLAIEDAKEKAAELAENLGIRLGKIINFHEDTSKGYPMPSDTMGRGGDMYMTAEMAAPQLPSGEQTVNSTIYIVYKIK